MHCVEQEPHTPACIDRLQPHVLEWSVCQVGQTVFGVWLCRQLSCHVWLVWELPAVQLHHACCKEGSWWLL